MKERLKNTVTTIIGSIMFLVGVGMIILKVMCVAGTYPACDFSIREIIGVFVMSYFFIVAKDSILEGLSLGFFRHKKS